MVAMLSRLHAAHSAGSIGTIKNDAQLTNRSRLVGGMIISRACGRLAATTSRFRSDGQPIESSSLSGWVIASPSLGKSQQRPQRIRRVVGGPAG
jgi:hypothetical protein